MPNAAVNASTALREHLLLLIIARNLHDLMAALSCKYQHLAHCSGLNPAVGWCITGKPT